MDSQTGAVNLSLVRRTSCFHLHWSGSGPPFFLTQYLSICHVYGNYVGWDGLAELCISTCMTEQLSLKVPSTLNYGSLHLLNSLTFRLHVELEKVLHFWSIKTFFRLLPSGSAHIIWPWKMARPRIHHSKQIRGLFFFFFCPNSALWEHQESHSSICQKSKSTKGQIPFFK